MTEITYKPLVTIDGTYYNALVFEKHFNLNHDKFFNILNKSKELPLLQNMFRVKDKIYLNVRGLLFIIYMYRIPKDNTQSMELFVYLLHRIHNATTLSHKLLGIYLTVNDLPHHMDRVLVTDNKESAGYLCLFKLRNSLIIGISYSPKVRLEFEKDKHGDEIELLEVLLLPGLTTARKLQSMINMNYHKLKDVKGHFKVDGTAHKGIISKYHEYTLI